MKRLLLASVAALTLTGAANAGGLLPPSLPSCTSTEALTVLQSTIQKNFVDVVNLNYSDDPYTLNMDDSDIIVINEAPHKAECKILISLTNKAAPDPTTSTKSSTDDDWITYNVQMTANMNKTYVDVYFTKKTRQDLTQIEATAQLKEITKKAEAEKAAQDEAANTIDPNTSCADGLEALKLIATNPVRTVSPGVCAAYVVSTLQSNRRYVYAFSQVSYKMTLDGAKLNGLVGWKFLPFEGQTIPQGVKLRPDGRGYYSDVELVPPNCPGRLFSCPARSLKSPDF